MQLVDFMTNTCAWSLVVCNTGNFGQRGDLREQQLIFRKDLIVQHGDENIMVELRDVRSSGYLDYGYIDVNGIERWPTLCLPRCGLGTWRFGLGVLSWQLLSEIIRDQKLIWIGILIS